MGFTGQTGVSHTPTHKHTHACATLIKQQFSGSLFSRYTAKIRSPAGENWGGKDKKKTAKSQTEIRNYLNNAATVIAFPWKVRARRRMDLNQGARERGGGLEPTTGSDRV